jgi:hypothetical protein
MRKNHHNLRVIDADISAVKYANLLPFKKCQFIGNINLEWILAIHCVVFLFVLFSFPILKILF